jgi:DNA-binding NarL/FixJ family response regulator
VSAEVREPPRLVHIDLCDTAMRFAFSFAADEAGWSRTAGPARDVALVADRVSARADAPPLDVLVLPPNPIASRRAIDAFTAGQVRAVVASTDPSSLATALEGARQGLSVLSTAIVEAAQRFPPLSGRLERTLHLVVRGRRNRDIARELRQSEATTKRDVAELLRRFDATNRVALAATALRLGLPPDGRS